MAGKRALDTATLFGLIIGVGSLIAAMVLEFKELNPDLGSAFLKLSALLIIFGGTLGCTMIGFSMEEVLKIGTLLRIAFFGQRPDPAEFVPVIVTLAEVARRDGILALESKVDDIRKDYPFLARGFRHVIDGCSAESVKNMLADEVYAMEERHKVGAALFTGLGGYAPTMGIVGTVVGLIGALAKAGESSGDPTAVVEAIATAFIATFYGIATANLFFLPIASKLQMRSKEETFSKIVQSEAILAIQDGRNPRQIEGALWMFYREHTQLQEGPGRASNGTAGKPTGA